MTVDITIHVRDARKAKGLTIEELSDLSGVSRSYISEIEIGKKMPTLPILCLLAGSLEVKPEELYTCLFQK